MAGDVDYMLRVVVADMQSYDVLQEADRRGAAEKRNLAFCDGEDQIGHRIAGPGNRGVEIPLERDIGVFP